MHFYRTCYLYDLYSIVSFILSIFGLKLSRKFENQADQFVLEKGYGEIFGSALKKLHEKDLMVMDPDPLYSQFTNSHPTLMERLKELKVLQKKEE